MKVTIVILSVIIIAGTVWGSFQPLKLIETPTAGIPPHGGYLFGIRQDGQGRLTGYTGYGFSGRFFVSVGYGGGNILGKGEPDWNPYPFVEARFRIIDESILIPAVAIGFSSFGYDEYIRADNRHLRKPTNFYVVGSKAFQLIDLVCIHGGVCFEPNPDSTENPVDLMVGGEFVFNDMFEIIADYRAGLNDMEKDDQYGEGRGYLNSGFRVYPFPSIGISFYFSNLLENGSLQTDAGKISRSMEITYEGIF
ncbi:MAG: hypothetical protein APR63_06395 [Desulfuromonas sp. SDB]|nr:MAG: hypothetical protein APR63_06395 [Desulfuromonas sp. SDB]